MTATPRPGRVTTMQIGITLVVLVLGLGTVLFQKNYLSTKLASGETVKADFSRDYRLRPYISKVKVAGVVVGTVTGVKALDKGAARVTMKLEDGTRGKVGAAPSAKIRPATLLGGNYYVDLVPGGDRTRKPGSVIPLARTTVPVELDAVLTALRTPQRKAIQDVPRQLDGALTHGGTKGLQELAVAAPDSLRRAADVLEAVRGTQPESDLQKLVPGLQSTAQQLSKRPGQLEGSSADLAVGSEVLAQRAAAINATLARAPLALDQTREGLARLSGVLDALDETSVAARPSVRELGRFLDSAEPAVRAARPVVADLRPLMTDLRATTHELLPAVGAAQTVVDDVRGPVIDRVRGPITQALVKPYRNGDEFYKSFASFWSNMNGTSMISDRNGSQIGFQPGFAGETPQTPEIKSVIDLLTSIDEAGAVK
ncbi:MAG: Mammalian cell entry related domain protein [Frankiales bacterium]|nr:Mammalian cell entry related domain protein [Frankiales bacterium]